MKLTARGGTDGANMVLFGRPPCRPGPTTPFQDDPLALAEQLKADGKLIWFPCDSDGQYTVAVFVRTPVPDELLANCQEPEHYPRLVVKGDGYFGGMEYMFQEDRSLLDRFPHMAEAIRIPDGTYAATVYQTDATEAQYEEFLRSRAGVGPKGVWDAHAKVAACAGAGVLASLIAAAVGPRRAVGAGGRGDPGPDRHGRRHLTDGGLSRCPPGPRRVREGIPGVRGASE